ncbi:hypothetical protein DPMN_170373 [Dreissena polymorpha]|uniref:Uncharacterized protein n=1 Tax=Dreissena polymorpha TaxID=45954 RepID=A0A9D4DZ48_DREPO|nr:hypothetical protein DPMN_170373 [Dreissena polymorpha]
MCTTVFKPCLLEVVILVSLMTVSASAREPDCSRFHHEEKLLEKMMRMEIHVETVDKHLNQCLDESLRREKQIQC